MPFHIDNWVVLPDHRHGVWTLPAGNAKFAHRWQAIKVAFSKGIAPPERLSTSRRIRGERGIWQRRFWEHTVRNEQDYAAHIDYVHFNPGLVRRCLAVFHVPPGRCRGLIPDIVERREQQRGY